MSQGRKNTPNPKTDDVPPPLTHQVSTSEFDEIAASLSRWDSHITQLDGGKFDGSLRIADLNQIQVFDLQWNRSILAQGGHPTGNYAFLPIESTNVDCNWRGYSMHKGMLNVRYPGEEMSHRTGATYASVGLIVDSNYLRQCARTFVGVELEDLLPRRGFPEAP